MANTPFLSGHAKWIWASDFNDVAVKGQFVQFRKTFSIAKIPDGEVPIHVSADTRYRLYLNGESISFGPCKSYLGRWNYETVDISPYLKEGQNVLAARVLRFSYAHDGCLSMVRSQLPGFILYCEYEVRKSCFSRLDPFTNTWLSGSPHQRKLEGEEGCCYAARPRLGMELQPRSSISELQ
jgi:hypothetical protein